MFKTIKNNYYTAGVSMTMGMMLMSPMDAKAQTGFSAVSDNLVNSVSNFPTVVSVASYILGLALGLMGVMKIKDHVENPSQTPLKEGAVRLVSGGALLALPALYTAMTTSIGDSTGTVETFDSITTFSITP